MKITKTTRAEVRLAAKMLRLTVLGVAEGGIDPMACLASILAIADDLYAIASDGTAVTVGSDDWLRCKMSAASISDPAEAGIGKTQGNA